MGVGSVSNDIAGTKQNRQSHYILILRQPTCCLRTGFQSRRKIPSIQLTLVPAKFQIDLSSGFSIVDQAYLDQQPQLGELSRKGVIITDQKGVQFSSSQGLITEVKVEEDGPLSAVLFLRGDHRNSAGEKLLNTKPD